MTKGEQVYRMRESGKKWVEIARALDIRDKATAIGMARHWSRLHDAAWPPVEALADDSLSLKAGEEAYRCKARTGQDWDAVAACVGVTRGIIAVSARGYALHARLPWPPPEPTAANIKHALSVTNRAMAQLSAMGR